MVDREAPTPRISEGFAFFFQAAKELADKLEGRFESFNVDQRFEARRLVSELRDLANRFSKWPTLPVDAIAQERSKLTTKLMELNRESNELLTAQVTR